MNDHPLADDFALYFRGLLDEERALALEQHTVACATCAARLRSEARAELAVYELLETAPPDASRPPHRASSRSRAAVAALALVAAALVGALALVRGPQTAPPFTIVAEPSASERTPSMPARNAVVTTLLTLAAVGQPTACSSSALESAAGADGPSARAEAPRALEPLPAHWAAGGQFYSMGVDPGVRRDGHVGLAIFSKPDPPPKGNDYGSLGSGTDAGPYRGKRVRLTGFAKADGVTGWAGLWLRVDGAQQGGRRTLAMDNMQSRPICGTIDWTPYELVLDVDAAATRIAYGSLLSGGGRLWTDPPRLDVVDASVKTTAGPTTFGAGHTSGLDSQWFLAGSAPEEYIGRAEDAIHRGGATSLSLASKTPPSRPLDELFGTAMQGFPAGPHRGSRVRLSAYVKTVDVRQWAGLWMRVDGDHGEKLAFDSMEDRPITGTTDWARYSIELDVPVAGKAVALGVLLSGGGHVWMDDVVLEDTETLGSEAGHP